MASDRSVRRLSAKLLSVIALAGLLLAPPALAEPSAADKETARNLMKEGDDKLASKDYAGAIKAYQAAHAIMQVPSTGLQLAKAQIERGLLVEARDTLLGIARLPKAASEPAAYGKARDEAAPLADKLAERIPSITISVEGPAAGAQVDVAVDGVAVPAAALGTPRKVNPGAHTVIASSSGFAQISKNVVLKEAENEKVALKLVAGDSSKPVEIKGGGHIHVVSLKETGNVIVDGKAAGATPLDVSVAAGPHTVEVQYPGGSRDERRVDVASGGTVEVAAQASPMDAVARPRKGAHTGFSAAPIMEVLLGGGGAAYGGAGSFVLNIGINPTFDFRTGAGADIMYRDGGPRIIQVHALIPAMLKVNWSPWFSSAAGLQLGFSGVFLPTSNAGNAYGFVIGPEWNVLTLSAGDKRQYELGFNQGMHFGTIDSGAWDFHQSVSFTYLFLE